jgi:hypothetical protein
MQTEQQDLINSFIEVQDIPGIQIIPVDEKKVPLVAGWQKTQTRYDLSRFPKLGGIGLATGSISGNVEVIDIDQKYSLDGKLFDNYKRLVGYASISLLKRLCVAQTRSGGYHIIYRCASIERNVKLAQRHSTDVERFENPSDRVRVLIETRGEGGQIVVAPTPGYKFLNLSLSSIPTISEEEREILISCARQLNEYYVEPPSFKPVQRQATSEGLSPGDDYNQRGDVVALLESHGWTRVQHLHNKMHMRRPGQTSALTSGNFDFDTRWWSVFTTSTQFEPEKGYKPWHVFAMLECKGDYSQAARKLYDMGYGERVKPIPSILMGINEPEPKKIITENLEFLAGRDDIVGYLRDVRNGTFKLGLSTGFPKLDEYFLFKQSNFVVVNGHANVGKTVVLWYLAMLSAIKHGWKWSLLCSENSAGGLYRKMIEFYWRKPLKSLSEKEFAEGLDFVHEHFFVIKNDSSYNFEQVLEMLSAVNAKKNLNSTLVDTYNSLEVPGKDPYQHHYNTLNAFRYWTKTEKCSLYVNAHPGTAAMRTRDENGHPKPPMMADTEQGTMFAAKADDFLTIHRKVNDEMDWRKTEIHVRKIKEVETGGRPTPLTEPFSMEMNDYCRFQDEKGVDPIAEWHLSRNKKSSPLPTWGGQDESPF